MKKDSVSVKTFFICLALAFAGGFSFSYLILVPKTIRDHVYANERLESLKKDSIRLSESNIRTMHQVDSLLLQSHELQKDYEHQKSVISDFEIKTNEKKSAILRLPADTSISLLS